MTSDAVTVPPGLLIRSSSALMWLSSAASVSSSLMRATKSSDSLRGLRSEEHTSELQSRLHLVCRLLLEKKNKHLQICSIPQQARTTHKVARLIDRIAHQSPPLPVHHVLVARQNRPVATRLDTSVRRAVD